MKIVKGHRLLDAILSYALFIFLNAGVVFIIVMNVFVDLKYPFVFCVVYIFIYAYFAIGVFGYRVREIDGFVRLSPPIGKFVVINIDEIDYFKAIFFKYIFILRSKQRNYVIWNTLNDAELDSLKERIN